MVRVEESAQSFLMKYETQSNTQIKNTDKGLSLFSFFSGLGILDFAFEQTGYDIVFVNEQEPEFLRSYQYAREILEIEKPVHGYSSEDVQKYIDDSYKNQLLEAMKSEREKGNLVGFIGGPPCPDFSVGGKNRGSTGQNGKLTRTYFDIISRCKPDFFLFENVKGLVRTEKHKVFFNEMKQKIQDAGYALSSELLNALDYGVPQNRERIIMVGVSKQLVSFAQNINYAEENDLNFDWTQNKEYNSADLLQMKWPTIQDFKHEGKRNFCYEVPRALTVEYWFKKNDVKVHPNGTDVFNVRQGKNKIMSIGEGDTSGKSFKRLHRWRYSPTAAYGNNEVHLHPYQERRLSVAEAMAIQSIPKEFQLPLDVSLSKKFKMVGNGVPYLMAEAVAKTLKTTLRELSNNGYEENHNKP